MGIVDDLLAHPGLYLGLNHDVAPHSDDDAGGPAAAKIMVSRLPSDAGVLLDYETFNPANPARIQGHREQAMLAKTHGGGAILVSAHMHAGSVAVLRESTSGVFELGPEASPFPLKIVIEMPEPGHLIHSWWYSMPGSEPEEKDRADLRLVR